MNVLIGKDKLFVKQLYIFVFNGKVGVAPSRWASVVHSLEYAVS